MARKISTKRTGNSGLLKDGIYHLVIVESTEKVSSSGNDMIELQLSVLRNGKPSGMKIYDNLSFIENEDGELKAQFKFDQLHDALDLDEDDTITYKFYKGKRVYASLITDTYNGRVKNKIAEYISPDIALSELEKQSANDGFDDEDDDEEDTTVDNNTVKEDSRKPANSAAVSGGAKRGRPRQQPVEMDDDDDDDMPI